MLRFWIILTGLCAIPLIVASCADPGTAVTSIEAAKTAEFTAEAATQAATQAATEMSAALSSGQAVVHDNGHGVTVVETKDFWVVYRDGKRYVIMKPAYEIYAPDRDQ
jgi:hypothetical protein